MKNPALKAMLCLVMCLPVVAAVFLAVNISKNAGNEDGPGRTLIVKFEDSVQLQTSDSEDLTVYDAVIANATAISEQRGDLEIATPYTVEFADSEGVKTYSFYMSKNQHYCVFADSEGNFFGMIPSDAEKLLARTEFAYVYAADTLPKLSFSCNVRVGDNIQTRSNEIKASDYDWKVKISGGDYKQCNYIGAMDENSFIKLSKGGDYVFSFPEESTPDDIEIKVLEDDKTIVTCSPEEFAETALAIDRSSDTWLTVEVTAQYYESDTREYSGRATYVTKALYDVPTTYKAQDEGVGIGEFTIVEIGNANPGESISVSGTMLLADDVRVQVNNGGYFVLVPADLRCTADTESEVSFTSSDWGVTRMSLPIRDKGAFDSIEVNSSAAALNFTDAAKSQFLEALASVLPTSERKKYWANEDDDFIVPCKGDYSNYGRRIVLGESDEYGVGYVNNIGIDIYAEEGTAVNPTHNGRVVYAGELSLSGKTIIIDHGYDVFSYYFHLGEIQCSVGDIVSKNSTIGTVGTSGFTLEDTPYLLFSVSIGSTYTNPASVFKWGIKIPE